MRFELYNREQNLTVENWQEFFNKILRRTDLFDQVTIEVDVKESQVTFHLIASKDFSKYSNEILPFILKTVANRIFKPLKTAFCFLRFFWEDNFIRIKEREVMNKKRDLRKIIFSVRKYFFFETNVITFYFVGKGGKIYRRKKFFFKPRYHLLAVDFSKTINYKKKSLPAYIKLQKQQELFDENRQDGLLEVQGFPYHNRPYYFPLKNFEYNKHSLIVGQTGTGKSKFIEFFIKDLIKNRITDEYTVVVIDPHAALYTDFTNIPSVANIDFFTSACKLFAQIGEPKVATELTILLFKTLIGEQFNAKMERVLKYTLHTLFVTVKMSIPEGLALAADRTSLTITGFDKELVGQFAANVRALKVPEPYKGKGIRYDNEVILRKQGKKAA
jgi:hypothetical protein